MNCHPSNANGVGCLDDAHPCILNQRTTKTLAMQRLVNSQAAQDYDWNGIWHVAAKPTRGLSSGDDARSQCVVSDNPHVITNHVSSGGTLNLVFQASAFEPLIQAVDTTGKSICHMTLCQRHRCRQLHPRSQGAGVSMVLSKRSLG